MGRPLGLPAALCFSANRKLVGVSFSVTCHRFEGVQAHGLDLGDGPPAPGKLPTGLVTCGHVWRQVCSVGQHLDRVSVSQWLARALI